jgi:hypothetical protein
MFGMSNLLVRCFGCPFHTVWSGAGWARAFAFASEDTLLYNADPNNSPKPRLRLVNFDRKQLERNTDEISGKKSAEVSLSDTDRYSVVFAQNTPVFAVSRLRQRIVAWQPRVSQQRITVFREDGTVVSDLLLRPTPLEAAKIALTPDGSKLLVFANGVLTCYTMPTSESDEQK